MNNKKKITIQDIATKAQVSISTVSRVLNNNAPVAKAKETAVLQAMAELNYQPNIFAQGLASGQSMTIGVLTQNISGPLYDSILWGVLEKLEGSGYTPLFADGAWQSEKEQKAIQIFLNRQVDGLIILGGTSPVTWLAEIAAKIPLVVVGRQIPSLACLPLDDVQGGYLATRYLLEAGHRSIAHITGLLTHQDAVDRRQGYCQALQEVGLEVDPLLTIEGNFLEQSGVLAIEMLLQRGRPFTAIFAANDQMAYGARLALFRRGIRVPEDVSLIGFDDQGVSAYTTPPLTTMHVPAAELGEAAAEAILQLIRQETVSLPRFIPKLVIRESVARQRSI